MVLDNSGANIRLNKPQWTLWVNWAEKYVVAASFSQPSSILLFDKLNIENMDIRKTMG